MMWRVVLRRKRYPQGVSSRDKLTWLLMPRAGAREAPGDAKSNNELKWCCNQRILKLVDCKIYNDLSSGKSIQSQSTFHNDRRELRIDFRLIYYELRNYRFCNPPIFRSFNTHSCMIYWCVKKPSHEKWKDKSFVFSNYHFSSSMYSSLDLRKIVYIPLRIKWKISM